MIWRFCSELKLPGELLPKCLAMLNNKQFYLSIYLSIIKLATVGLRNPEAPFPLAAIPRREGGCYPFSWIAPLSLVVYLIMLSVKQGGIKYQFFSLWYHWTWDWTSGPRPWVNILPTVYIYIEVNCGNKSDSNGKTKYSRCDEFIYDGKVNEKRFWFY